MMWVFYSQFTYKEPRHEATSHSRRCSWVEPRCSGSSAHDTLSVQRVCAHHWPLPNTFIPLFTLYHLDWLSWKGKGKLTLIGENLQPRVGLIPRYDISQRKYTEPAEPNPASEFPLEEPLRLLFHETNKAPLDTKISLGGFLPIHVPLISLRFMYFLVLYAIHHI